MKEPDSGDTSKVIEDKTITLEGQESSETDKEDLKVKVVPFKSPTTLASSVTFKLGSTIVGFCVALGP